MSRVYGGIDDLGLGDGRLLAVLGVANSKAVLY